MLRIVWVAAVARAAVKVPEVVTALDGVEDKTVPSPVKVTLVTVPLPPVAAIVIAPADGVTDIPLPAVIVFPSSPPPVWATPRSWSVDPTLK